MKKILIACTMLLVMPLTSFAQTEASTSAQATATATVGATIANPGLTPGDFLYFLDRWSEAWSLAFTVNKEKKAHKNLEYAKERVAEMNAVLKKAEGKLENIARAKENFDEHIARAADIAKKEKDKGKDVANLARELDDELDDVRDELKNVLKEHKDSASHAEEVIRAKLASLSPTDPQFKGLTQALESIMKEKDDAGEKEDDVDTDLEDEMKTFEELMGKELAAQKHLERAMRLRDRIEQDFPGGLASSSVKLMRDAEAAMNRGDFESAKRMSEQAKEALEKVREISRDENDDMTIDESHIDDLEEEIKNSERVIEDLDR